MLPAARAGDIMQTVSAALDPPAVGGFLAKIGSSHFCFGSCLYPTSTGGGQEPCRVYDCVPFF